MSGQEIGGENPCESRHVAKRAVDLEHVHDSEMGHDVPQSIYLEAGVKLLVEDDSHHLDQSLIEFQFDAVVTVNGESGVTIRGAAVWLEIEDEHE